MPTIAASVEMSVRTPSLQTLAAVLDCAAALPPPATSVASRAAGPASAAGPIATRVHWQTVAEKKSSPFILREDQDMFKLSHITFGFVFLLAAAAGCASGTTPDSGSTIPVCNPACGTNSTCNADGTCSC